MLSNRDVAALSWFFTEGVAAFERSTMGAMLERAEMYFVDWREVFKPVDVRITAEDRGHGGVEPEHRLLVRYGEISRRLMQCSARAQAALQAAHGDRGDRFARADHGRMAALFHLVPAGQALIERERAIAGSAGLEMSDAERLFNALVVDRINGGDGVRRKMIKQALVKARDLYELAGKEYAGHAKAA